MEYMTVREAGERWGLGIRVVTLYCSEERIDGAVKKGNLWLIPEDAARPEDRRRKKSRPGRSKSRPISKDIYSLYEERKRREPWPFESLYENQALFAQIVKEFPCPLLIFAPDGTMLLANEKYLKFAKISNPEKLYKKHNILLNPDLERWGIKDFVLRAFQGEAAYVFDIKVPYQEVIKKLGDGDEMISGSLFHNITALPIRDSSNRLSFIVFIFTTSRSYQDRDEIIKGKEYIEGHWKEKFDIYRLAGVVHMSRSHYTRLFKQHTGMTPYNYYQDVKINRLKDSLCDQSISITQIFDECGVDYNGKLVKRFKDKFGMTPSQYRARMAQK